MCILIDFGMCSFAHVYICVNVGRFNFRSAVRRLCASLCYMHTFIGDVFNAAAITETWAYKPMRRYRSFVLSRASLAPTSARFLFAIFRRSVSKLLLRVSVDRFSGDFPTKSLAMVVSTSRSFHWACILPTRKALEYRICFELYIARSLHTHTHIQAHSVRVSLPTHFSPTSQRTCGECVRRRVCVSAKCSALVWQCCPDDDDDLAAPMSKRSVGVGRSVDVGRPHAFGRISGADALV